MESAETSQLPSDPVEPLRFDIGRIGIDKTAFFISFPNELQGVFVLQRHIF